MRQPTRLAACLLAGLWSGGCGDATSPETVSIASMPLRWSGGSSSVYSTARLFAGYGVGNPTSLFLDTLAATSQDVGAQVVLTSDSAGFGAVAPLLTNGVDDQVLLGIRPGATGSGGVTRFGPESNYYENRVSGSTPPDLHGFVVQRVIVELDTVMFTTPGTNPNGNGNWTDFLVVGRIVFEGHR